MSELIPNNAVLWSLLTFFLGLALGHRLGIVRDQRKELNEAAKPIRAWLLAEADTPSPYRNPPTAAEIDLFAHGLSFWKKNVFLASWACQGEVRNRARTQDLSGQVFYGNKEEIREAVKKCLSYTERS